MIFVKPAQTYEAQLNILMERGLSVPDRPFALQCLEHLNYYRLSAYRFPLAVHGCPDQFLKNTSFTDLWNLYHFDRTLRRLVLDSAKRVEISVRSRWAYVLGHRYGSQAYEDAGLFKLAERHGKIMRKLDEELRRSKEDFVKHFKLQYNMQRPPIWAACEVCSFGQVSHFFEMLKKRQDRKEIANTYSIDESVLASFLHHLTVVRNHAAHHARIWNRKFTIKFKIPSYPQELASNFSTESEETERRIYNTLTMLLHLLNIIEPKSHLPRQLREHIESLDAKYLAQMGFPAEWETRPLWKQWSASAN